MRWKVLADAVVTVHVAFVLFAVCGGFMAWRWRRTIFLHLPALAWAAWVELSSQICPLTPLENHLRRLAGESGYDGGFIEHYVVPLLYPIGLTCHVQWVLAAVLVGLNAIAYGVLIARARSGRARVK